MIKRRLKYLMIGLLTGLFACGHAEKNTRSMEQDGTTVLAATSDQKAFSQLSLDSVLLEQYISSNGVNPKRAEQLRQFYQSRSYQFAWFHNDGLAQQARAFWNLHNNYLDYTKDSSLFNKQLHQQMNDLVNGENPEPLTEAEEVQLELQLTNHFFDYAHFAYAGKIDPNELQWHIARKKLQPVALLDSLVSNKGKQLEEWEPVSEAYKRVRKELPRLYQIQKEGGWPVVVGEKKVYRLGDSAVAVVLLKQRLKLAGDYTSMDESPLYTAVLERAVKKAQMRFGLMPDGVAGPQTLEELNTPIDKRIRQLLVNMERMRWMPAHQDGLRLVANIPEFRLHVINGSRELFNMKIVVGKAVHETVIFNDKLKYIVFSPYWNVPNSIVRNEILPAMRNNPAYLSAHNMEKTGERNGLPVIRQKPGSDNALGRVKFIFPNNYAIYFHDTPAKSLFDETQRAFSHGCIRLEEPERLARFLLKDRDDWNASRIADAMYSNTEKWVKLEKEIPVEITYFTAWADENGVLNFRDDIYGHDAALARHLFEE